MITLYLIFKLTGLVTALCLWMVTLPFRLIALPFRILFGKPGRKERDYDEEAFWQGVIFGSIFMD